MIIVNQLLNKTINKFVHLSSLHSIIWRQEGSFSLLWSLLAQAGLSFRVVIVVQKSYSGD